MPKSVPRFARKAVLGGGAEGEGEGALAQMCARANKRLRTHGAEVQEVVA